MTSPMRSPRCSTPMSRRTRACTKPCFCGFARSSNDADVHDHRSRCGVLVRAGRDRRRDRGECSSGDDAVTLTFTVYGVPRDKGNMRSFWKRGMKKPIITDSNRNARSWSQLVAEGANRAIGALPVDDRALLFASAIRLSVAFYLPRPKKYQKRGLGVAHLTAPDIDKLVRAILDALTQVAWGDDSQVVELLTTKAYADVDSPPHADIRVERTSGARAVVVPPAPLPLLGALS